MSKTVAYKLKPRTSFHVGEAGVGLEKTAEKIHSDTLFSAIASAWRHLGDEVDGNGRMSLLKPFDPGSGFSPPFRLSSAFPYAKDVLLYPAPLTKSSGSKEIKKAKLVSRTVLLSGDIENSAALQSGEVRVTQEEKVCILRGRKKFDGDSIWWNDERTIVPRVTVDRVTSASEIYHCGELLFHKDCGLYFWVKFEDESYDTHVERAVDFLSEEGLGGERSSGCGQFEYEKMDNVSLPTPNEPKAYMTLSLYHPTRDEVDTGILDDAAYGMLNRRGWLFSPDGGAQRRRSVRMLVEGSVFSRPVDGDVVDIKPENTWNHHPVYRSGLALMLPVAERWEVRSHD